MKILNLSLDKGLFDPKSVTSTRVIGYSKAVERLDFLVPHTKAKQDLSEKVVVYGVASKIKPIAFFQIYFRARKLIKQGKYDLVSTQEPFELGVLGWLLKITTGIKLHVQEHGDFFTTDHWRKEGLRNTLRYPLGKFILRRADSVRAVSNRIAVTLQEFGVKKEKITVVPVYVPFEEKQRKDSENFVFLSMARFEKQKNIPLLVEGFEMIAEKHPKAVLRIVGSGSLSSEIELLIEKSRASAQIEILDWTDDPEAQYAQASAFVLSSNYEGWGRVIVEAAQFRLPIVMTRVGCADEFIKDKEDGLVVDVGNATQLSVAMNKCIEDVSFAKRIGENAYKRADVLLDKAATLEQYVKSWKVGREEEKNRNILVVTQAIDKDDPLLGFFLDWIHGLAQYNQTVRVICLKKGEYTLPDNVKVLSLGKEIGKGKVGYIWSLYKYCLKYRKEYDRVFVHMNPVYVVLVGWLWRLMGKRVSLWFAHYQLHPYLRIAEKFCHVVFTSVRSACLLDSKKVLPIGQGIDVSKFDIKARERQDVMNLLFLGRISPLKELHILIAALAQIPENILWRLDIVGDAPNDMSQKYFEEVKSQIKKHGLKEKVLFHGRVEHSKTVSFYQKADVFVNMTTQGCFDKTVLEAMSTGCIVVASNPEYRVVFPTTMVSRLCFQQSDVEDLVKKLNGILKLDVDHRNDIGRSLRKVVVRDHSIDSLAQKITSGLQK